MVIHRTHSPIEVIGKQEDTSHIRIFDRVASVGAGGKEKNLSPHTRDRSPHKLLNLWSTNGFGIQIKLNLGDCLRTDNIQATIRSIFS
ncbi:hypothetical protein ACSL103130_08185 [Actinomyces slackii]|uniref:Uncharacterized protein n=1 Tax=Actinomyces slackii TaxID=52774 RepID=A0A3S4SFF3_9ACTO|nr:Uncharacterised protein [Actinomyces slackii]